MTRPIKFRAWDKENKQISSGVDLIWFLTGEPDDMQFPPDGTLPLNDFKFYLKDFELMQFTGLTDKNGKEIWEEDIVRQRLHTTDYEKYGTQSHEIAEVRFDTATFILVGQDSEMEVPLAFSYENIEVIGNIYENPELLEKPND